jgi:hypothetical protein
MLTMKTHNPLMRTILLSMLIGLLMASAAMAKGGGLGMFTLSATGNVAQDQPTSQCGSQDQESDQPGDTQDQESDQPGDTQDKESDQPGDTQEQESDLPGSSDEQESDLPGSSDQQESDDSCDSPEQDTTKPADNTDREKACKEAAGVTDLPGGSAPDLPTEGKTTGLDHAIQVVMANCIKNPQAPGLLNALRHLVANRAAQAAREAERAARRDAHDEAKAEGHGPKGNNGHGHSSGD